MSARDVWLFAAFTFLIVATLWHTDGHHLTAIYWYMLAAVNWLLSAATEWKRRD